MAAHEKYFAYSRNRSKFDYTLVRVTSWLTLSRALGGVSREVVFVLVYEHSTPPSFFYLRAPCLLVTVSLLVEGIVSLSATK
jgi:hypothetical protein